MITNKIIYLIVLFNRKNYKFENYLALASKDRAYTEYYLNRTTKRFIFKYSKKEDYYKPFI